jgi:hypothetical protein
MKETIGCDLIADSPTPTVPSRRGRCSVCGEACWVPLSLTGIPLPVHCVRCICDDLRRSAEATGYAGSLWLPPSAAHRIYGGVN